MLEVLIPIRPLVKVDKVCIDNTVFRLHYLVTFFALLVCVLFVAAKQYIGEPIDCVPGEKIERTTVNAFCWIHSTYVVRGYIDAAAYPGVGPTNGRDDLKQLKYYQWVIFMLLLQAFCFFLPRYLWKYGMEGGRMKELVQELTKPIGDTEKRAKRKPLLVNYLLENMDNHGSYAIKYCICETMNLVNVLAQIIILHVFLDGEFLRYGRDVFSLMNADPRDRHDPMEAVFPKMAKCTFKRFGPSGDVVPYDNLCILPINNINEKIFAFLWLWYIILACITSFNTVFFRVATIYSLQLRFQILRRKSFRTTPKQCDLIARRLSFGDWFILAQIGSNVDAKVFAEVLDELELKLMDSKNADV